MVNEGEYRLRVSGAKYAKVNGELQAEGTDLSRNWRQIGLPQYVELPQNVLRHLEHTTILKLNPGSSSSSGKMLFESLTVSGEEPEWSVNFKKALVVLFTVRTSEPYSRISENFVSTTYSA